MALLDKIFTEPDKKGFFVLSNQTIKFFLAKTVILFVLLLVTYPFLGIMYSNLLVNTGNTYFKYAVNKDYKLKRNVSITNKDISDEVLVKTVILDKYDSEGKPIEKTISTNLRRECWLPLAIIISLMLSSPFFTRKSFLMNLTKAILLIQLFIGFKLYVFAYDNYNYPEFAIKKLPFLIDGIVYYGNAFLNITGSSTTVIIPFFIWLIIIGVQLIGKVKFSD